MSVEKLKQSILYQTYFRPLVWMPIRAYKYYRRLRNERHFNRIAKHDGAVLAEARLQYEPYYAAEKDPLISVTIPTYNRGQILVERTLPSVLCQTYQNFEIVVVGDHCTDDTAERILKIKDQRVRFYNLRKRPRYPKNKRKRYKIAGAGAINLAIAMSHGSWMAHLDDDDVFTPDHLEKLLAHAQAGGCEFVSGRCRVEVRSGQWIEKGSRLVRVGDSIGFVSHSCVLYRSYLRTFRYDSACLTVGLAGDAYRWRRLVNAGVRTGFVNDVVALQLLRPGETVRSICQPA